MQISHSRNDCFQQCPYKYDLRYNQGIRTLQNDDPANALLIGQALHTGLEKDVQTSIHEYFMSYPVITDEHINEAMKLEYLIPKAAMLLPSGEYEVPLLSKHFIGYIDLLSPVDGLCGCYDLYDFKYSNNVKNYLSSDQLHLYKYFWEKQNPGKYIRNMYFLFVPKVQIKQKKTEDLFQFRQRIQEELLKAEPQLVPIEFNMEKVVEFMLGVKEVLEAKEFPKEVGYLCNYCDYQGYCQKGEDYMLLPKNERRDIEKISKKVIWIYGTPFSGKTTFANQFPDPLMLNTDGNIKFVDAPYIPIKDQVVVEGRMTKRTLAWDVFKDALGELEKKQNDFRTIIIDLLEDAYESCRLYMYQQMGITHESDDSFRAWDKVRTEFLSTLKRAMNLDYENIILISHEDTSKDITKKGGDKITAIKPNLQEKTANKVAGMVDIVARVIAEGDVHTLSFKTSEVIFGGGRLKAATNEIPLDYNEFLKVYSEANKKLSEKSKKENKCSEGCDTIKTPTEKPTENRTSRTRKEPSPEAEKQLDEGNMSSDDGSDKQETNAPVEEAPRGRKSRTAAPAEKHLEEKSYTVTREPGGRATVTPSSEDEMTEPVVRTRKKRGE